MERRVQELKCWEIITLQMCVLATPLEVSSRRMQFLMEAKYLLSSPGKMIGEQYRIIGIAQAEQFVIKGMCGHPYTYIYIYINLFCKKNIFQ